MDQRCQIIKIAVEAVIDRRVSIEHVTPILQRAAMLAEDLLLATGCLLPSDKGTLWRAVKQHYLMLQLSGEGPGIRAAHEVSRSYLRKIATLADDDLTMDPRPIHFDRNL